MCLHYLCLPEQRYLGNVSPLQAFSMANFPTLEDAAVAARSGREREEALAMDGMLEALQQLKISE